MSVSHSSEYNQESEVLAGLAFPDDVFLVDSTIRSLQSGVSGSKHTVRGLVEIGRELSALGVRQLIVNLTWKDGLEVCAGLAQENLTATIVGTGHFRSGKWPRWANEGIQAGVDEICIESASDPDSLRRGVEIVRSQGRAFSHGFAELYSYEQVRELCAVGVELGCTSLNFHDSFFRMGIHPEAIKYFIRKIRRDVPAHPPLIVHLSNFFGHATMTAVAALTAGASAVDVCMNAVGHHCGHTSLPEVVMTLESLYGVRTGIQLDQIRHVAELVERETGIHKQSNQPIIGEFAFAMDGAYWSLEADKPYDQRVHAIYPFSPEVIGAEERVVWSERSVMPESVGARLQLLGLSHDATAIEQILAVLAARLASKQDFPNWMLDEEFTALCRETLQAPARRQ